MKVELPCLKKGASALWDLARKGARHGSRFASSTLLLTPFLLTQSLALAEGLNTGFDASYWQKIRAAKGIPEPGAHHDSKAADASHASSSQPSESAGSAASSTPAVSASSPEVCSALEKEMSKMACRFSETCGKTMGKCSEEQTQCKDSKCLAKLRKKNKDRSNSKQDGKKSGSSNEVSGGQEEEIVNTGTDNSCDEDCQRKREAEKLAKAKDQEAGHSTATGHSNTHATDQYGLCVEEVKSGKVAYDQSGSSSWNPDNIKRLCNGVTNSAQRIGCFRGKISSGMGWSPAIDECVSGVSNASTPNQPKPPANSLSFTHGYPSTPTAPSPIQEKTPQISTALERPGVREKVLNTPSAVSKSTHQDVSAQQVTPSYAYNPPSQAEIRAQTAPSYALAPSTASNPPVQQVSAPIQQAVVPSSVQIAAQQAAARQIAQNTPSVPTISAPSRIPSSKLNTRIPSSVAKAQGISALATPPSGWGNSACYSESTSGARVVCWYDSRVSIANCPVDQGYRPDRYNGGCYAPALDSVPASTRCTAKNYERPSISFCSDVPR